NGTWSGERERSGYEWKSKSQDPGYRWTRLSRGGSRTTHVDRVRPSSSGRDGQRAGIGGSDPVAVRERVGEGGGDLQFPVGVGVGGVVGVGGHVPVLLMGHGQADHRGIRGGHVRGASRDALVGDVSS